MNGFAPSRLAASVLRRLVNPLTKTTTTTTTTTTTRRTFCQSKILRLAAKSRRKPVLTSNLLFPKESDVDAGYRGVDEPFPSSVRFEIDEPVGDDALEESAPAAIEEDDEGDFFGSLASPETRQKMRNLEGLWALDGWRDETEIDEQEEEEEEEEESGVGKDPVVASQRSLVPTRASQKDQVDETLKPSLLYPGDSAEKALKGGPRTNVAVVESEDGEIRDRRWYHSKIHKLVRERYDREALQMHDVHMKLEHRRINPNFYTYK